MTGVQFHGAPGFWIPVDDARVLAVALREYIELRARLNGAAPSKARAILQHLEAGTVTTSAAAGSAEVPEDAPSGTLLTVSQAVEILRDITDRGVRGLCRNGTIDARMVNGAWLMPAAAVESYKTGRDRRRNGSAFREAS